MKACVDFELQSILYRLFRRIKHKVSREWGRNNTTVHRQNHSFCRLEYSLTSNRLTEAEAARTVKKEKAFILNLYSAMVVILFY